MLPKFRVNLDEATMVPGDDLKSTVAAVFEKMGVPPEDAQLGADVLVLADLRGVDSHGVSNMLRSYVNGYTSGQINPNPQMRVIRETPSTASLDSDRGLGIITTPKAMDMAIRKAAEVGIGMVTLGNARHLGMASYHAMKALEHDHDRRVHDQLPALGRANVWRRTTSGHQSHRHRRAVASRGAVCVRRRHEHRRW